VGTSGTLPEVSTLPMYRIECNTNLRYFKVFGNSLATAHVLDLKDGTRR
jgi:hypothetical protein